MTFVKTIAIYASGTVIASYLMFRAYVSIKYPFWTKQPVFFPWNLTYWLRAPFTINDGEVVPTKYTNFTDISFSTVSLGKDDNIGELTRLVGDQYLRTKECHYAPSADVMTATFDGHSSPCYVSLYKKPVRTLHSKFSEGQKGTLPSGETSILTTVGGMTTRPVKLRIKREQMQAYYVDLLCVHSDYRKKRIANQIIETHHYYQRKSNPDIKVSLFKREGMLMRSMPLCEYSTICFKLPILMKSVGDLIYRPCSKERLEVLGANCDYLLADYVASTDKHQSCLITSGLANLSAMIKQRHLIVAVSMIEKKPMFAYVFRENQCLYKGEKTLTLIATLLCNDSGYNNINGMYRGGMQAIRKVALKNRCGIICIEMIGLTAKWAKEMGVDTCGHDELPPSPTGYYLYNYACLPLEASCVTVLV